MYNQILFVDDEKRWTIPYMDELELEGYEVHYRPSAEKAQEFFDSSGNELSLLILDIMMPRGNAFPLEDAQNEMRTGVMLYDRIRKSAPNLPIIILTNVSDSRVRSKFQQEKKCVFVSKSQCLPHELIEKVEGALSL